MSRKNKKYKTIVIDPPWPERGGGRIKRGADRHYKVMRVSEILKLPVAQLADKNCILWLWSTSTYLKDAFRCIAEWGFTYVAFRPWVKAKVKKNGNVELQKVGLGQRQRGDSEIVLLCRRGRVPLPQVKHRQSIHAPRTKLHSEKPEKFYKQLRDNFTTQNQAPRLDMFARKQRDGWDVYGDEVCNSITLPNTTNGRT